MIDQLVEVVRRVIRRERRSVPALHRRAHGRGYDGHAGAARHVRVDAPVGGLRDDRLCCGKQENRGTHGLPESKLTQKSHPSRSNQISGYHLQATSMRKGVWVGLPEN